MWYHMTPQGDPRVGTHVSGSSPQSLHESTRSWSRLGMEPASPQDCTSRQAGGRVGGRAGGRAGRQAGR